MSNWLRPDAATSPERFCHCYARGKGNVQMIPGWPYSLWRRWSRAHSWTLPLDAVRLGPADDGRGDRRQIREVIARLIGAGHWRDGDPDILMVSTPL